MRALFRHYYQGAAGLVYILDIAARDHWNMMGSSDELIRLLSEPQLLGLPLLILGNKADLPTAMTQEEIEDFLDLKMIQKTRQVTVRRISIQNHRADPEPINDSLSWLKKQIEHGKNDAAALLLNSN
jgi:signal recognition particle receptor subunit beta